MPLSAHAFAIVCGIWYMACKWYVAFGMACGMWHVVCGVVSGVLDVGWCVEFGMLCVEFWRDIWCVGVAWHGVVLSFGMACDVCHWAWEVACGV